MNKFIHRLRHPLVEAANIVLQLWIIYRFSNAANGLFNTREITSDSSVIGQFFGTTTSLTITAVLYVIGAALLVISLVWFAIKKTRRLNNIALVYAYVVVSYTLTFIALFNPDYIGRMALVLAYSTVIIVAWLRNKLIDRQEKIESGEIVLRKPDRHDLLED